MSTTDLTYAQQDALARLGKRHRDWDRKHRLDRETGLVHLTLPGDEPEPRRRRTITKTGLIQRVTP